MRHIAEDLVLEGLASVVRHRAGETRSAILDDLLRAEAAAIAAKKVCIRDVTGVCNDTAVCYDATFPTAVSDDTAIR